MQGTTEDTKKEEKKGMDEWGNRFECTDKLN